LCRVRNAARSGDRSVVVAVTAVVAAPSPRVVGRTRVLGRTAVLAAVLVLALDLVLGLVFELALGLAAASLVLPPVLPPILPAVLLAVVPAILPADVAGLDLTALPDLRLHPTAAVRGQRGDAAAAGDGCRGHRPDQDLPPVRHPGSPLSPVRLRVSRVPR